MDFSSLITVVFVRKQMVRNSWRLLWQIKHSTSILLTPNQGSGQPELYEA